MKKISKVLALALTAVLALSLTACGGKKGTTITVGATPVPHEEILEIVKPILAEQNITLEIKEFTDYRMPPQRKPARKKRNRLISS